MCEISIKDIENIKIGAAENFEGGTGCTVIICENGAPVGLGRARRRTRVERERTA